MIESSEGTSQATLGETAVADMRHLSHGEVFVGHLGSLFGKVSWQPTALALMELGTVSLLNNLLLCMLGVLAS
jgi:hypothetical protein